MQSLTLTNKLGKHFHKGRLKGALVPAFVDPYAGIVTLHTKQGAHNVFVKSIEPVKPEQMGAQMLKDFGFKSQKKLLKTINEAHGLKLKQSDTLLALHWI